MVATVNNRRTQYTRTALKNALLTLLQTKRLAQITVTALCQTADINRGTFYAHYDNPAQLFTEIEQDLVAQIKPLLGSRHELLDWLPQVLAVIRDGESAATIILQNIDNSSVLRTVLDPLKDATLADYGSQFGVSDPTLAEYCFDFFINGAIAVINRWLAGGCVESPQAIAAIIAKITAA